MAYVTAPTRASGDVITAGIWNQDVRDNVRFLKGTDGLVTLEDSVQSDANDTDSLGTGTAAWRAIYAIRYMSLGRSARIGWEGSLNTSQVIIGTGSGSGGKVVLDGFGQLLLQAGTVSNTEWALIGQADSVAGAFSPTWPIAKHPSFQIPFGRVGTDENFEAFLGFRVSTGTSGSGTIVPGASENHAGIYYNGTNWRARIGDGTVLSTGTASTLATGTWHNGMVMIRSTSRIDVVVDGTTLGTFTGSLPSGGVAWQCIIVPLNTSATSTKRLTIGEIFIQQNP